MTPEQGYVLIGLVIGLLGGLGISFLLWWRAFWRAVERDSGGWFGGR